MSPLPSLRAFCRTSSGTAPSDAPMPAPWLPPVCLTPPRPRADCRTRRVPHPPAWDAHQPSAARTPAATTPATGPITSQGSSLSSDSTAHGTATARNATTEPATATSHRTEVCTPTPDSQVQHHWIHLLLARFPSYAPTNNRKRDGEPPPTTSQLRKLGFLDGGFWADLRWSRVGALAVSGASPRCSPWFPAGSGT